MQAAFPGERLEGRWVLEGLTQANERAPWVSRGYYGVVEIGPDGSVRDFSGQFGSGRYAVLGDSVIFSVAKDRNTIPRTFRLFQDSLVYGTSLVHLVLRRER